MNPIRLVAVSSALAVALLVWAQAWKHEWLREEFERRAAQVESLTDFATPPIPDDQNVAAGLREVAEALKKHNEEAGRPGAIYDDEWLLWEDDSEWKAEGQKEARKYLESVAPVIDKLERILGRPRFRTATDWSKGVDIVIEELPLLPDVRDVLEASARFARNDKQIVRACRLLLRMAERCEMPFVIGELVRWQLVRGAVSALRVAPISDAAFVRAELDGLLARAMPVRGPSATILKQGRAIWIVSSRAAASRDGNPARPLRGPELYRDALGCLDLAETAMAKCVTTPEQAYRIGQAMSGREHNDRGLVLSDARDYVTVLFRAYAEVEATVRLARTALAVLETRQRTGDWPATLPMPQLVDPLGGGLFTYVRGDDDVRLYAASRWWKYGWEDVVDHGHGWSWPRRG